MILDIEVEACQRQALKHALQVGPGSSDLGRVPGVVVIIQAKIKMGEGQAMQHLEWKHRTCFK